MTFTECVKVAFGAMSSHKLRSFLTMLGMIIGVTAFMLILSALLGFNAYVDEKIARIGSNSFEIKRFALEDFGTEDSAATAQRRNKFLTFEELEFIKSNSNLIANIGAKVAPILVEVRRGTKNLSNIRVSGTDPTISVIENLEIEHGRYFVNSENDTANRVAYIGKDIADELFPNVSPINSMIYLRGIPYRVIGVQAGEGSVFGMSLDNFIVIPIKTYSSQFGNAVVRNGLSFVGKPKFREQFSNAVEEARTLLRVKRKLHRGEKDNFGIYTPEALAELRDNVLGTIFIVILTVPAIALLVGAIVIMNTMLVTVTERTKEIGLRKALGATRSNIMQQFMLESATLAIIGGLVGIIFATTLRVIVSSYGFPTRLPWWAVVGAIAVCGCVGLLSGFIPARKAASLAPIKALQID